MTSLEKANNLGYLFVTSKPKKKHINTCKTFCCMYWYVSIYSEEFFWHQYMDPKLIPFIAYHWCPLCKLSHLGLEQLWAHPWLAWWWILQRMWSLGSWWMLVLVSCLQHSRCVGSNIYEASDKLSSWWFDIFNLISWHNNYLSIVFPFYFSRPHKISLILLASTVNPVNPVCLISVADSSCLSNSNWCCRNTGTPFGIVPHWEFSFRTQSCQRIPSVPCIVLPFGSVAFWWVW